MGTEYEATNIANGVMQQSTLNQELQALQTALERALSIYGDATNGQNDMQADLDMNSNDILNVGQITTGILTVGGVTVGVGAGGIGGGLVPRLCDLLDVDCSAGLVDMSTLVYNAATATWVSVAPPTPPSLCGLGTWLTDLNVLGLQQEGNTTNFSQVSCNGASNGNYIVTGNANDATEAPFTHGSFTVFFYDGAAWTEQQRVFNFASDGQGRSVDISPDGDGIVVATSSGGIGSTPTVQFWQRAGTTWALSQTLAPSSASTNDFTTTPGYGHAMRLSPDGNTLAIGGPNNTTGTPSVFEDGTVWMWELVGGVWVEQQKINPPSPIPFSSRFGSAIALGSDTLAVTEEATSNVYVYPRVGLFWGLPTEINGPGADFGQSLDIVGDYLAIGDANGSVRIYLRPAPGDPHVFQQEIQSLAGGFGITVKFSRSHDQIFIGAPDIGEVHIWNRTGTTWAVQNVLSSPTGRFGSGLAPTCQHLGVLSRPNQMPLHIFED